jgi:chemosensory pili system protein ChpA (sensor histidine kinase/response regulator)
MDTARTVKSLDAIRTPVATALLAIERSLGEGEGADARNAVLVAVRDAAGVFAMAAEADLAAELDGLGHEIEQSKDEEFGARATGWIATLSRARQRVLQIEDDAAAGDDGGSESMAMVVLALLGNGTDAEPPDDREPLRTARARYERTLLQALKGSLSTEGAAEMVAALEEVERHFAGSRDGAFWTLLTAALEAIRARAPELDAPAKRFCGALNLALRRAQDGEPAMDAALAEAAIALVSRSAGSTQRIERVRAAAESAGASDPALTAEAAQAVIQSIVAVGEAVERIAGGDAAALPAAEGGLSEIESACNAAGARRIGRFASALLAAVRSLHARKATVADGTALAVGLQLLEQVVNSSASTGRELQKALTALGNHLTAVAGGADASTIPDEVNTRASGFDRAGVRAAGKAIQSGLSAAEVALEVFFQAPTDATGLEKLSIAFGEIAGTFAVLGAPHAERTARECASAIAAFPQSSVDRDAFDRVAEQIAALGAFVDVLIRDGNAREDDHPFCCSAAAEPVVALTGNGESAVQEAGKVERPNDPDLAPIFLEEAREVLGTLEPLLANGLAAIEDRSHAVEVRRGFHTLKGSGRMVGLEHFAHAAWCVEEVLNAHIEHGRGNVADLATLARKARERCADWIVAFESHGEARIDARQLEAWADRIKRGEPIDAMPAPVALPVAEPVHQLSANLYGIFRDEAARHLASMRADVERLRADATRTVTPEFMLAKV